MTADDRERLRVVDVTLLHRARRRRGRGRSSVSSTRSRRLRSASGRARGCRAPVRPPATPAIQLTCRAVAVGLDRRERERVGVVRKADRDAELLRSRPTAMPLPGVAVHVTVLDRGIDRAVVGLDRRRHRELGRHARPARDGFDRGPRRSGDRVGNWHDDLASWSRRPSRSGRRTRARRRCPSAADSGSTLTWAQAGAAAATSAMPAAARTIAKRRTSSPLELS